MLEEYANTYQIPCCNGFLISHEEDKYTLPIGLNCNFSADDKIIELEDCAFLD
jgi:muramoyltetrapeptide carboxypeptidase LdcA involved in peptidoglycan recycling